MAPRASCNEDFEMFRSLNDLSYWLKSYLTRKLLQNDTKDFELLVFERISVSQIINYE